MGFDMEHHDWEEEMRLGDALVEAAQNGDAALVREALRAGASARFDNSRALRRAATCGHDDIVALLLENGADIHAQGDEALRFAAGCRQTATVALLLEKGANANALEGEALVKAATRGDAEMVQALLKHGADVHAQDDNALRRAAFGGHVRAVSVLLAHGADSFAMFGFAFELARIDGHENVMNLLAEDMHEKRTLFAQDMDGLSDTKAFFRAPYADTGEPALVRAVKMNSLPQALLKMKETGDGLSAADVNALSDRARRSLAQLCAARGQLDKLFDVELWKGRVLEMEAVWSALPHGLREKCRLADEDISNIANEERCRRLREKSGRFKLKPH